MLAAGPEGGDRLPCYFLNRQYLALGTRWRKISLRRPVAYPAAACRLISST
jgi:hypothetical protein